jgi:hypothetical protein
MTGHQSRQPARYLEEDFVNLICADDEWVRAEFDAIIAAEWHEQSPRAMQLSGTARTPRYSAQLQQACRSWDTSDAGMRTRGRQRSPPEASRQR